jgi:DNA-binding NarL/FixJ family response regulator
MLRKGCKGYLLKGIGAHTLAESIQEVYNGKEVLDSAIKRSLGR